MAQARNGMIYKEHGRTGKELSIVGFGGMRFKNIDDTKTNIKMMVQAAQAGINYFDTAPAYFGTKSEEVFGKGFAEMKKLGLPFYSSTKTFKSKPDEIRRELDAQLKRLKLDYVDFYHIWNIVTLKNWEERKKDGVLEAFAKLKEEGLIKHICVSHHLIGEQITPLLEEELIEAVLFGYSAYNFKAREAGFETIRRRRLGAVVMNPLGGGIIPQHAGLFEFLKTSPQQSVVEAALHFLFAHGDITTSLVGFSTAEEIQEAVAAVDNFKDYAQKTVSEIKETAGDIFSGLCTGCQYCDNCPEGIQIPMFMDAYNYKLLYKSDKQLSDRLKWHWNLPRDIAARCTECGLCEELCTQHLPIIERLREIAS